ncbi:amylo-alpha-1,6-glucosidase [Thermobifida halotolerans]|uniref:Amylo-alpha-1,6-glucosidase n=1 Tax=Thermobifida halotolerans TaxID=483545 RepID=A0AA97LTP7_9ACTN|nr:glycogen debranching N-terminal domain-containing protein [Thermobifida halotolerans]UOE17874.1 amylo-alpha-1,6-glucosidase [Thermobifida halotolerans]
MTEAVSAARAVPSTDDGRPLQPLLHDSVIVFRAPTQAWSGRDGDMGDAAVHGLYHGDTRVLRAARVRVDGRTPEAISLSTAGASRATFVSLPRHLDGPGADPRVRFERERAVADGSLTESLTLRSRVGHTVRTVVTLELEPDFSTMHAVKAGIADAGAEWSAEPVAGGARVRSGETVATVASDGSIAVDGSVIRVRWEIEVPPHRSQTMTWSVAVEDPSLVVVAARGEPEWAGFEASSGDPRLDRWVSTALEDLAALRLARPDQPDDAFLAAGAPWFFTLFGRDSIWAARFLLPLGTRLAASTLRVLARLQGRVDDPVTAEQPGKIMHELRSTPFEVPGEGMTLPPVYYGTVDATALWVCLLADAWEAGMPEEEVRELLPTLRGCLDWLTGPADSDGDGFIDYIDRSGRGLANQGWKDSGDSIQWRSGTLAEGPIALCEVQGYAYEAAVAGARLLSHFGEPGAAGLGAWAAALKSRFASSYWVSTPEGRYPAVALDARKRPVDTLTSNIGHLIGTGVLSPSEEKDIAALLVDSTMSSGFGLRTMSTGAAGYWPLSYHGGSVWTHDTAITIRGMRRAGLHEEAGILTEGLLAAAESFDFRLPELHSGDPRSSFSAPSPYPAACRPQAWSAAAALAMLEQV